MTLLLPTLNHRRVIVSTWWTRHSKVRRLLVIPEGVVVHHVIRTTVRTVRHLLLHGVLLHRLRISTMVRLLHLRRYVLLHILLLPWHVLLMLHTHVVFRRRTRFTRRFLDLLGLNLGYDFFKEGDELFFLPT